MMKVERPAKSGAEEVENLEVVINAGQLLKLSSSYSVAVMHR
jgi:hypothetical protein